jgi:hypothetical protein
MINEIATIDVINLALDQLDEINYNNLMDAEVKVVNAKDTLITYRDKLQSEVDQFEKWAEEQSNIDTAIQLEAEGK